MMNLEFLKHNEEELTVNITSLIDVIFILLIFFMVSTQFKRPRSRLICHEARKLRKATSRILRKSSP